MGKVNKVIRIPASLDGSFFIRWFEFLRPYHKLTDREIEVIASFVKQRYELSKAVSDPVILDRITMSEETKRKVREDCKISQAHFQVIMTKLKKSKMIENGTINPKFIPMITEGDSSFNLLLSFELE